MTTQLAFIAGCDTKTITRADGGSFSLYQIHDNSGQVFVAKKDVWDFAQRHVGQQVQMLTRVEQKGKFTNYYCDAVIPMNGVQQQQFAHPLDNPQGVTQGEAVSMNAGWNPNTQPMMPTQTPQTYTPPGMPLQGNGTWANGTSTNIVAPGPTDHDLSIYRQVAAKVAASHSRGDDLKFWTIIPELMVWFKTGSRPHWVTEQEEPQKSEAARAYALAGEAPPPPTDDDIPF